LLICEKITFEKSYPNIQDIGDLRFLAFLTVHDYLALYGGISYDA
jgi:hypothetical protein